jgi:hypothetical protein
VARSALLPWGIAVEQIVGRERNLRACYRELACNVVACRRVNSIVRRRRDTHTIAMKTILSLLLFVLASSPCLAQERGQPTEQNLYYRALVATLAARAKDSKYAGANDPRDRVIIQNDIQLNNGFPTRIGDIQIEYLGVGELRDRYRSLKHELPVFVMRPISNENNRLVIGFARYWFSATKRTNSFALEGGYRVVLRFDCAQNDFVIESTTLWGI